MEWSTCLLWLNLWGCLLSWPAYGHGGWALGEGWVRWGHIKFPYLCFFGRPFQVHCYPSLGSWACFRSQHCSSQSSVNKVAFTVSSFYEMMILYSFQLPEFFGVFCGEFRRGCYVTHIPAGYRENPILIRPRVKSEKKAGAHMEHLTWTNRNCPPVCRARNRVVGVNT